MTRQPQRFYHNSPAPPAGDGRNIRQRHIKIFRAAFSRLCLKNRSAAAMLSRNSGKTASARNRIRKPALPLPEIPVPCTQAACPSAAHCVQPIPKHRRQKPTGNNGRCAFRAASSRPAGYLKRLLRPQGVPSGYLKRLLRPQGVPAGYLKGYSDRRESPQGKKPPAPESDPYRPLRTIPSHTSHRRPAAN